jgi:hypothetical protein
VSAATISRHLTAAGPVTREPSKRPRWSYIRFAAELPNEWWQSDFTHYPLAEPRPASSLQGSLGWSISRATEAICRREIERSWSAQLR